MAVCKKAALSSAGASPVIREVMEAEFIERFANLIDRFDASIAADSHSEFAGAEHSDPHEHTTRVHFLDELVELLGWSLGLGGDMAEEVRLRGEMNRPSFPRHLKSLTLGPTRRCHEQAAFPRRVQD